MGMGPERDDNRREGGSPGRGATARGRSPLLLFALLTLLVAGCGDESGTPIGGDGGDGGDWVRPPATEPAPSTPQATTPAATPSPSGATQVPTTPGGSGVTSGTPGGGSETTPSGAQTTPPATQSPDPCTPPLRFCDGLCINPQTSMQHCGVCDQACVGGQQCSAGSCVCPQGETFCPDEARCIDLEVDPEHCGGCGDACGSAEVCEQGECGCGGGLFICGGECVDRQSDVRHCGGCDQGCKPEEGCYGGECRRCPPGEEFCSEECVDVRSSPVHCGGCDAPCEADESCRNGSCGCPGDHLLGNQSRETAWLLPFGTVDLPSGRSGAFTDLFRCPGESDWFRIEVPGNGATFTVDVGRDCTTEFQPRVTLHSGSSTTILVGGGANNCTRGVESLAPGTHYLEVSGNAGEEGVYDLRYDFVFGTQDGTHYNSPGSANGTFHRPFQTSARLDVDFGNPQDYYLLDLHYAGIYSFETSICGYRNFLRLEDEGGQVLAEGTLSGNCSSLQVELAPARYFLRVSMQGSDAWGSYMLRMSGQPVRAQRPQITPGTATDLGFLPTAGEGALLAGAADPDHWRVRLSAASDLVVETRGLASLCETGTVIEVRTADGATLIAAGSGGGASAPRGGSCTRLAAEDVPELRNLAAGDYLVTVRGEDGATGPYLVSAWVP